MTCQSRSLFFAVAWSLGCGSSIGSMSGWFELFQLPLDNQTDLLSRTATLMWYAVGKIQRGTAGFDRTSAQAELNELPRSLPSACTVSGSVWSAVGFLAGLSRVIAIVFVSRSFSTSSRMCPEVKSYMPTVRLFSVAAKNLRSVGQPASG